MKIRSRWLKTEAKRAGTYLPALLIKAVVTAVIVVAIAFCAYQSWNWQKSQGESSIQIGYVAGEDTLLSFAVTYVEQMPSVRDWCRFTEVTEPEGRQMIEQGELAALLIFPENMIQSILSGSNEPAQVLLPSQHTPLGLVFEELCRVGVGVLQTAQAQIYAAADLAGADSALFDNLNRYNLNLTAQREYWFRTRKLSAVGQDGIAVYYASALLTLCLLLAGLFAGGYLKRSPGEQMMMQIRGVSVTTQNLIHELMITGLFAVLLTVFLLAYHALTKLQIYELTLPVYTWRSCLLLAAVLVCMALQARLLYQAASSTKAAVLLVGMTAIAEGYLSGCLYPTALLPDITQSMSAVIPATYVKRAFTILLTGNDSRFVNTLIGLVTASLVLWGLGELVSRRQTAEESGRTESIDRGSKRVLPIPDGLALVGVTGRRLLAAKSFWLCLIISSLFGIILIQMEQEADTTIYAAVYEEGESKELAQKVAAYQSESAQHLIAFWPCDSIEELQRMVLSGEVQSGYVLPEDLLQTDITAWNGSIRVYEAEDAVLTPVIQEVVFSVLFEAISTQHYEQTMQEWLGNTDSMLTSEQIQAALRSRKSDNSTFSLQIQSSDTQEQGTSIEETCHAYPVWLVTTVQLLLCAAVGLLQTLSDHRRHRFHQLSPRRRACITFLTIAEPIALGGIFFLFL